MPSRRLSVLLWLLPSLLLWLADTRTAAADDVPVGEGEPFVRYWSPREFHGSAQSFCVTQDARGVMYFGNAGSVLEYDGSTWRHVPAGSGGYVSAMACEAGTDRVYVGTEEDLGYLQTEPGGARSFVSLLDRLPEDERGGGICENVYATPDGVYFLTSDRVLRWRSGQFKTWKLATSSVLRSQWAAGRLYVSSPEIGLLRLEGEEFVPASEDGLFRRADVSAILPGPDGSLLVGTVGDGLFLLHEGVVRPLESECGEFFKEKHIARMLRLHDSSLAVATDTAGLVLLDPAGRFRTRLDKVEGLRGNFIRSLFEDAEGGLWLGLESGLARVEVDSPLSFLRAGPDDQMTSTYAAARWFGTVVLGNMNGVYRPAPPDPAAAVGTHLEQMVGTADAIVALDTVANGTLVVAEGKVALLDAGGKLLPVAEEITNAWGLVVPRSQPGIAYVCEEGGRIDRLRLEAATGSWVNAGVVAELGKMGRYDLAESAAGDLWADASESGLFRVQINPAAPAKVTSVFDEDGPLHGVTLVKPAAGDGPLVLQTSNQLWRFDEGSQAIKPLAAFGEQLRDGSVRVEDLVSYDARTLWLTCKNSRHPEEGFSGRVVAGQPGGAPVWQALPHKIEEVIGGVMFFHPVEPPTQGLKSVLIVGTTGSGVVRLDVPRWEAEMGKARPFATLIRRAFTTQGQGAANGSPILREPLPYVRNTAHFEFAAGTLALGAAPRFQTRLGGFGAGVWSEWSEQASVDYLNLPEGRYTFEVRARNSDGQMGSVASMGFHILPPWQRSPWAYALYTLGVGVGVWGLVRWRGQQLRGRNAELETVVAIRTKELRGREAELVRARDDAEAANRAKSAFLANMSHELRTPLNAVLGYAQLLLKQPDLSARSREQATVIGQSGGHLLSLVNEVLDLSKVEAGKLTLNPFDFPLGQLLDEVSAAFRPRLAEKTLAYTEKRAAGLPISVRTDPSRLRQVLFNLLSNAVKFTQLGGVTLSVRPTAERQVRFEVADTGVGIAPEDQRDIFMAFYQAGESHLASQGTGLGLTISQRLVELLGGRIELESTPGAGSRFWFELPLGNVEAIAGSPGQGLSGTVLGNVQGYEGATRRLLLVDDLAENRRVLRDFLQPLGFEIEEAADGPSTLMACARQAPDAVLLDLRLGVMNGFQVARTLRANQNGTPLGIIAISASVFEHDRQQAIDAGCDDFLPKPFEETQLLGTLGRVLGVKWVQETRAVTTLANDDATLPADEIELLRKLSRRGDTVGIRRHLDAWRMEDDPARTGELARRLEALLAAYDLDGIDALLLNMQSHADARN